MIRSHSGGVLVVYLRFNSIKIPGEPRSLYLGGPGPLFGSGGVRQPKRTMVKGVILDLPRGTRVMWISPTGNGCRQMVEEYIWNAMVDKVGGSGMTVVVGRIIDDHGNYQHVVDTRLEGMSAVAHCTRWAIRVDTLRVYVKLPLGAGNLIPPHLMATVMDESAFKEAPNRIMVQGESLRFQLIFENSGVYLRFSPLTHHYGASRSMCLAGAGFATGSI